MIRKNLILDLLFKLLTFIADRKFVIRSTFFIMAIVLSSLFTYFRFSLNHECGKATLSSFLSNSAHTPFQFRVLIPWVVHWLFEAKLPLPFFDSPLHLFMLIELLSVFSTTIIFRYYILLFLKDETQSTLLSFSLFYILPFNFILPRELNYWYPWDMPSILFFTLGIILLYRKNWITYYILFVIATLNRETTCFLTFIYLFTSIGKSRYKSIMFHCVFQAIIWIIIKYILYQLYANNPGDGLFENHALSNINYLLNPKNYPFLFSTFGYIWIPTLFLFRLIRVDFVKKSLFVIFPFFLGMMYVGNIQELRIYGELIPIILMAFLLPLKELLTKKRAIHHFVQISQKPE